MNEFDIDARQLRVDREQAERHRRSRLIAGLLRQLLFVLALFAIILLRVFVIRPVEVQQNSMAPTLAEGDRLLVNTWSTRAGLPPRGTVIVLQKPQSDVLVVKRVIGVGGDKLRLTPYGVWRNGKLVAEPYVKPWDYLPLSLTVPDGQVFVLGDNRPQSEDSRDFGPVPAASILGTAVYRFWPWPKRGRLAGPSTEPGARP
ncbi:MAG: signal peptidase I [Armatimonadetes bacterium]|nr:signal peptidase I [Armatimonadota bacterium]